MIPDNEELPDFELDWNGQEPKASRLEQIVTWFGTWFRRHLGRT